MRLWTVQPLSALEEIEKTGFFRCQREKSFNLTKPDSLEKPYQWLMGEMRKRLGPPPRGVSYPVWAWHTWEFLRQMPDVNSAAFLRRREDKALLTIEVSPSRALLSDFDAWQLVLQNMYVADEMGEAEYDRLQERLESLEADQLQQATELSWQNVFLTDPVDSPLLIRGKYVQATLWEIQRDDVKSVRVLPADG